MYNIVDRGETGFPRSMMGRPLQVGFALVGFAQVGFVLAIVQSASSLTGGHSLPYPRRSCFIFIAKELLGQV